MRVVYLLHAQPARIGGLFLDFDCFTPFKVFWAAARAIEKLVVNALRTTIEGANDGLWHNVDGGVGVDEKGKGRSQTCFAKHLLATCLPSKSRRLTYHKNCMQLPIKFVCTVPKKAGDYAMYAARSQQVSWSEPLAVLKT